jgi:hypothetical protein
MFFVALDWAAKSVTQHTSEGLLPIGNEIILSWVTLPAVKIGASPDITRTANP